MPWDIFDGESKLEKNQRSSTSTLHKETTAPQLIIGTNVVAEGLAHEAQLKGTFKTYIFLQQFEAFAYGKWIRCFSLLRKVKIDLLEKGGPSYLKVIVINKCNRTDCNTPIFLNWSTG